MPTLIELFNNKKYETLNNQTPKDAFGIRDSKTVPISSTSFALNKTATPAIIRLRNGRQTERLAENRIEQENVGLLPYANFGAGALYGTDLLRLSSQQTSLLQAMKSATGGAGLGFTAAQVVGDTVAEAVKFGGSKALGVPATFQPKALITQAGARIKNTLGSLIPDVLIPSRIATNPVFSIKVVGISEEYRTHELLANLKALSAGTRLATFVARNATGTPDQIKNALVNQGLNIAQQEAKKFVARGVSNLLSKGGEKSQQIAREMRLFNNTQIRFSSLRKYSEYIGGEKTFGKNDGVPANGQSEVKDNDAAKRGYDLSIKWTTEYSGETDDKKRGKKKFAKEMWASQYSDNPNPEENESIKYSKSAKPVKGNTAAPQPAGARELDFGIQTTNDKLNSLAQYNNSSLTDDQKKEYDLLDYVPLKFSSVANNTTVQFRGTITGLSEQFSPTWDSSRFIGSPFNFYTYQSIERSVQFTFKVFALNVKEHKINWGKLGYLSSLVYPQKYENVTGAVTAPFLKVTLGDMYRNKECFIENMTYNIDDDYPWEVGLNNKDLQHYRLPMIIEVTITLKFVEAKSNTYNNVIGTDKEQDKSKVGGLMYGYKLSSDDVARESSKTEKEQFRSTNNQFKTMPTDIKQSPQEEDSKNGEDPYPQDNTPLAEAFRKQFKLNKTNIFHTPEGQTVARQVYQQKKTKYLYFGDGSPYTAFPKNIGPDLKEKQEAIGAAVSALSTGILR
jgi:hypothetical protein